MELTSVGIDLGTSTTKMIVSRLRIKRTTPDFSMPMLEIAEKKLIYSSPIYNTPLLSEREIDIRKISEILKNEYENAKLRFSDIKTGAVIITGETAEKKNADKILHQLAERAGDFVVATAGADLEAILAGKGSGALACSKETGSTVANIDIGGGTANVVLFEKGEVIDTVTFHIGGKIIELASTGEILSVSENLLPWLSKNHYVLKAGEQLDYGELMKISDQLISDMFDYLTGKGSIEQIEMLILGERLKRNYPVEQIFISGGVGSLMHTKLPENIKHTAAYGDIGPALALSIQLNKKNYTNLHISSAPFTQFATVIGAGMQSTEISGATIFIHSEYLPLRNVPVLKLTVTEKDLEEHNHLQLSKELEQIFKQGKKWYSNHGESLAVAISGLSSCSYRMLQNLADALSLLIRKLKLQQPLIVVCDIDIAKALGNAIYQRCRGKPAVICIDQISVSHGDFIDLGTPVSGDAIPVITKTLVFPKKGVKRSDEFKNNTNGKNICVSKPRRVNGKGK